MHQTAKIAGVSQHYPPDQTRWGPFAVQIGMLAETLRDLSLGRLEPKGQVPQYARFR
jgi:hypothetical protein